MAAYAAVVSLMNIMDQIQIHPRLSTCFNKKHIESLGDTLGVLLGFIEAHNCGGGKEVEDLEGEIASAAHAAEDVIESHIVDQIHAGSTGVMCDLQKVAEDMDSIKENVIGRFKDPQVITCSTPPASSSTPVRKTTMVGFRDYLIQLMDKLTGQQSHQQVIPIIGMGGVGKTTLARNAFENLLIKQHFDISAWATISQNYSVRELLLQLLSIQDQEGSKNLVNLNELELGERLHKFLFNRRYLIVLDDMWGIGVWDDIKFFFPDNNNGSRIVLTTRLLEISHHFNSPYLTINLLDEDKSWKLFCQESFDDEGCPAELEEAGKKICENCKGLPLSIVVIGGFLRKSNKALEFWEGVARDTNSILSSEGDNQCMHILSSSYNHLPPQLKPCFLYMGIFAEDKEILVSQLIRLWVAEGFLKPNDVQSLEEVAEVYLKDLVDRNLVLVNRWGSNGKIKACKIHDLIRELCLSVAEKEKFLCVLKLVGAPPAINRSRRIVIHERMFGPKAPHALGSASLVRSLICKGHRKLKLRLLRVLSVVDNVRHIGFLEADLRSVNLRCLDHQFVGKHKQEHPSLHIPKKISLLWNLQTLKIEGFGAQIIAPSQLWEMVQLRHLLVTHLYVPDLPQNDLILPNLQTLGNAVNFQLNDEVCKRIPNVKRLRLRYFRCDAASDYCPQNLGRFHKLESLWLDFSYVDWRHMVLNMTFPTSLKKLTLYGGHLHWEDLEMIGSLPNLEVLKLRAFSMIGSEWNPCEGGFLRLKYLQIYCCTKLSKWNAEDFHFPVLEKLFLGLLCKLDEIPSGIGEIPTLRVIRLYHCELHCALSAVKILEEQESLGNEDLHVEVEFHIDNDKEPDMFKEMVEQEGFTSNNLHIKRVCFVY